MSKITPLNQLPSNSREAYRHYIFVAWKNNRDAATIHTELTNVYDQEAPSIITIRRWIREFKKGRENFKDNPRSGRPREAVTQQNILKIQNRINEELA